jgi:hypothetical protein
MSNVVAYLNFGSLHLLHITPARPWIFAPFNDSEFKQPSADFNGFAKLEEDMLREIECFSRAGVSLIVVQTPHMICDDVFGGAYKTFLHEDLPTSLQECVESLKNHFGESLERDPLDLCKDGLFNKLGSQRLAERMRAVVSRYRCDPHTDQFNGVPVCLVDAYSLTSNLDGPCSNYTKDGRHYDDSMVTKEVEALARIVDVHSAPSHS